MLLHALWGIVIILWAGGGVSVRAQTVVILHPKRVVKPDTPPNIRLVAAVERGDLVAVQAALRQGASADAMAGEKGSPYFIPVALLASQLVSQDLSTDQIQSSKPPGKHPQFLSIFRLLIQKVTQPNTADNFSGITLLLAAVRMGDFTSVKALVAKGADVNARLKRYPAGGTALSESIDPGLYRLQNSSGVTAYLLDHGAAVNAADEHGTTPLMLAAQYGKTAVARALLARGADPARRDKDGWTALRWASFTPVSTGDEVVALLRDRSPMTLHEAAEFGDVTRVRARLDAGDDPNALDERGMTSLMNAMGSGSVETARLLLDRGADVTRRFRDGSTALHLAAFYGDTALVSLLLDRGADINAVAMRRSVPITPLRNAVQASEADVVALLLQRGADLKHGQGETLLEITIQKADAGVMPPRQVQNKPLSHDDALAAAQWRIITLLLGAGVDMQASRALFLAANNGQIGLVELLLSKGADVNGRTTVGSGSLDDGRTALMGAINVWCREKDSRLSEDLGPQCVKLLLAHGADVNLPDAQGTTPLMQCASSRLSDLAEILLAHGAQVDAANSQGITALMWAAAEDDRALVTLLLAHHADVDLRDKLGRTALMLSIDDGCIEDPRADAGSENEYAQPPVVPQPPLPTDPLPMPWDTLPNPDGHPAMVRLLLRQGATVHTQASDGTTALRLARKHKFTAVTALLTQAGAGK